MKCKNCFTLILGLLVLSMSSCFQVIEEITMHKDGTGEMTLTINLSQSKTKLASIMLLDSINGYKVPDKKEIQKRISEAVAYLKKSPGISNVKSSTDFSNFIGAITFSFKDVSNLNGITKDLLGQNKIKTANISHYSYNKATAAFSREHQYSTVTKSEFNKLKEKDKEIFKTATFTNIWRFENNITKYSNKLAKVSKSQKAIMQQCAALDIINGKVPISNHIQLSR